MNPIVSLAVGSNSFAQVFHPVLLQTILQSADDGLGHAGAFIDQTRVKLNQRSAGGDFLPCVRGVKDSPDTDDWYSAPRLPVQMANDLRAPRAQWRPAQTSRLAINAPQLWIICV